MRLLTHDGSKFIWTGGFATKDAPKAAGFRWDPTAKRWWTSDPARAVRLREEADEVAAAALSEVTQTLEASRAVAVDIDVACPDGLSFRPFQRAGIAWLASRDSTLLADQMGLGKTVQVCGLLNADPSIRKVLISSPLSVKRVWLDELTRWLVEPRMIGIATAKQFPETEIVLIHHDVLAKHAAVMRTIAWDLIVVDEAHLLRSRSAQRTRALFGTQNARKVIPQAPVTARRRVALTGTPIPNRPAELWPVLNWLDPIRWSSFWGFAKRYAGAHEGRYGWDFSGATHLDELQQELRSTCMIRRLKTEVLTELPPKTRQIVVLDPDDMDEDARAVLRAESDVAKKHETLLASLRELVASASDDEYKAQSAKLAAAQRLAFEEMAQARHDVAVAKAPYVARHVSDLLDSNGKVAVWAHHHDVIDALATELAEHQPAIIDGRTSQADRGEAVERFQTIDSCRVFIGSITAAGTGITLTASSNAVFAELDWVPGNMSQAEDRHHRIGQQDALLVQHVVVDGSIDRRMVDLLVEKQLVADKALDREVKGIAVPADQMVQDTRSDTRPVTPDHDLSDEAIAIIHEAIRIIAAMDADHARELNGVGFSRLDGVFGHSLADSLALSQRQARAALKLALKYRRQLSEDQVERLMAIR